MIDPRTTNIIGERVLIRRRSLVGESSEVEIVKIGHGIVRVVDNQQGCFILLIEAVGTVALYGDIDDGSLFQISLYDETTDVVVDHEDQGWEMLRDGRAYVRGTLEQRTTCLGIERDGLGRCHIVRLTT